MSILQELIKLQEAVESETVSFEEELEESADANSKFKIEWIDGSKKEPKEVDARFFNSGNGFDDHAIEAIHELTVGSAWAGQDSLKHIKVTRLTEEQFNEKVFDNDRYDWYVWTEKKPTKPFERRGGAAQIERGMQFGLRAATSKPGTWRLVLKQNGPSIIFSIEARDAQMLIDAALKLK